MNKLLILSLLVFVSFGITTRQQNHLVYHSHFLDGQLCLKRGGFVCGFIDKDCCAKGCDSKMFGMHEQCTEGKHLDIQNLPSCEQLCKKSNGVLFKNQLLGDSQCCKQKALVDNKCPDSSKIDISGCGKGTLAGKIVGFVSHYMQKQN